MASAGGIPPTSSSTNPGTVKTIRRSAPRCESGRIASAFDAYCRGGQSRSPHWLFDEPYYRRRYPDLTDDALQAGSLANGYDHFLRHGAAEGRIGHPLFDAQYFVDLLEPDGAVQARERGPFRYYLQRVALPAPEPRTTPFFDPAWYLRQYPQVAEDIAAGTWRCALHHYLCNDTPDRFRSAGAILRAILPGTESGRRGNGTER